LSSNSPGDVNGFHNQSDVDTGDFAQHHTLGWGPGQAAPGPSVSRRFAILEDHVTDSGPFTPASGVTFTGTPTWNVIDDTWVFISLDGCSYTSVGAGSPKTVTNNDIPAEYCPAAVKRVISSSGVTLLRVDVNVSGSLTMTGLTAAITGSYCFFSYMIGT
jgi:hypothetical protein